MSEPAYYVLDGDHNIIPATAEQFSFQLQHPILRRVDLTVVEEGEDGVVVSTVFLGIDHNFSDEGPPLMFETLVIGGEHAFECERTATWEEAEQAHDRAVERVRHG